MKKLVSGSAIIALASALRVAVQIAILPVIGRILGPAIYGQMALVGPFVFFAMVIAEAGLGGCIIRAATVTRALEGTVFCFSTLLTLVLVGLLALVARPLGGYLQDPMFAGLLMGMSSIMVLASFNIVPAALLLRRKQYGWIAASDLASSFGSVAGVGLGIALGWGAWSLVAQQVAFWSCKVAVVMIGSRAPPRLIFRWSVLKETMQFGSQLTASAIVAFVARNIDNILIGRFMGTRILGYYALAFQVVAIPQMVVSGSVYFTLFAGTSDALRSGVSPKPQFLATLRGIMLLCMPALVGLAATANLSLPLIMGQNWGGSARLVVLLAPLGLCQTLGAAMAGAINGLGRAGALVRVELLSSLATIAAIVATARFGSDAVAIGVSLTAVIFPVLSLRLIARECAITPSEIVGATASPIVASLLMGAGVAALQRVLPPELPSLVDLVACVAAGALLYVAAMLALFRDRLSQDLAEIRLVLRKKRS